MTVTIPARTRVVVGGSRDTLTLSGGFSVRVAPPNKPFTVGAPTTVGPRGPQGEQGPPGPEGGSDLVDLTILYDNGLV